MSRKIAREIAFKVIFQTSFQKDEMPSELIERMFGSEQAENEEMNDEDNKYIGEITEGVKEKEEELDHIISKHLKQGWSMERISKVDVSILRLAIYEIIYREDIPFKVSVNEAVELAKTFGEDSSPSFINGILAEIINSEI